jgi:hypothetical protein
MGEDTPHDEFTANPPEVDALPLIVRVEQATDIPPHARET